MRTCSRSMISAGAKHLITMCLALVVVSAAYELDGGIFRQGDLISPKGGPPTRTCYRVRRVEVWELANSAAHG
jgi:hypothetical protein